MVLKSLLQSRWREGGKGAALWAEVCSRGDWQEFPGDEVLRGDTPAGGKVGVQTRSCPLGDWMRFGWWRTENLQTQCFPGKTHGTGPCRLRGRGQFEGLGV